MVHAKDEFSVLDIEIEELVQKIFKQEGMVDTLRSRLTCYVALVGIVENETISNLEYKKLVLSRIHHGYTLTLAKMVYVLFWPKR